MTSLGRGGDEVTDVPVPVLVRRLLRRACRAWRLGYRLTGRAAASLDRAAGTNQEIEPGEPKNRGESSVPGLADWLLAAVAASRSEAGS